MDTMHGNEIAVIGMACRFPGAPDLASFWQNLKDGVESITELAPDQLERSVTDRSADPTHPDFVAAASAIDGIELFDAQFFGYAPGEAALIDPQQRLFLEYAWSALESAGYDPERCSGAVGVFAGARANTYLFNLLFNRAAAGNLTPFEIGASNDYACLSTRVAYKLNLRGPAYAIHTACSTGLAVVHLACQSLLVGECRMALAGGVSISMPQRTGYLYREGGIVSPDGHCRAFDAQAAGTVLGSGIGVVVLKRLEDALADGDTIHAVIKGSAVNNDGAAKASYTAPSVEGQARVVAEALTVAGVAPASVSYIEAHGTGTNLGDPIEVRALNRAFRGVAPGSCAIGSVKTNLGHLESAAGLAGLIKTVLALKHRQLPPSLHFNRPNPQLELEQSPFTVNTTLRDWEAPQGPRRAGVSSFGVGGTNIHLVLEEAPPPAPAATDQPWQVLLLSAKSATALEQASANLADFLERNPQEPLADVAYTLQVGRSTFDHRRMVVCQSHQQASELLRDSLASDLQRSGLREPGDRAVTFLFAGQGSQHPGMAAALYQHEPIFREQVDYCAGVLAPLLGCDLRQLLYAESAAPAQQLNQTELAQPALFVVEYALAQLLIAWGVRPSAMIGHSIGEYVAATLAGVFSLDDALRLVALRGRLMQDLPAGAMLSVELPEAELRASLPASLDIAAINGPRLCVVAGPPDAVEEFASQMTQRQVQCRQLHTSHAFHSRMVAPAVERFAKELAGVALHPPTIPFISNISGSWISSQEATDPQYWANHIRSTVQFERGLRELLRQPAAILLEVGPGSTLSRLAQQHPDRQERQLVIQTLAHPREQKPDAALLLAALGQLWLRGVAVDWARHAGQPRRRVALPTYPFERQRLWIAPNDTPLDVLPVSAPAGETERQPLDNWFAAPSWQRSPTPAAPDWSQSQQRWLVFAPQDERFSSQLIALLREAGQAVRVVYPGQSYQPLDAESVTIDPQAQADYAALASDLQLTGELPQVLLHLWNLGLPAAAKPTAEHFDAAQIQGFNSLLLLAQAFGGLGQAAPLRLAVLSQQIHDVTGDEQLNPEQATVLGPCMVIPQEYPQIACRSIDLRLPSQPAAQQQLARLLIDEIGSGAREPVVAWRGRHRWVQQFVPAPRTAPAASPLQAERVYLITGGLTGVGYSLASALAQRLRGKLVLLNPQPLPPRETWQSWLASNGQHDPTSVQINNALALEATGADLRILQADLTDRAAVQAALAEVEQQFGGLHGVIHAAGLGAAGPIAAYSGASAGLASRAKGLLHLCEALDGRQLDFFVLCSSLNALVGEYGQAEQCAANSFLDRFAQAAPAALRMTAINWDVWQADAPAMRALLRQRGLPEATLARLEQALAHGIEDAEGLDVLLRVVAGPPQPQLIVAPQGMQVRLAQLAQLAHDLRNAANAASSTRRQQRRPDLPSAYVAPRDEEERQLAEIWQDVLGIAQIGIHDDFFALGGHSLLVTMIVGRMRDVLGVDIPIDRLFESPTIAGVMETRQSLQSEQDSNVGDILSLLAQLSDADAEAELQRRLAEGADD